MDASNIAKEVAAKLVEQRVDGPTLYLWHESGELVKRLTSAPFDCKRIQARKFKNEWTKQWARLLDAASSGTKWRLLSQAVHAFKQPRKFLKERLADADNIFNTPI